MRRGQVFGDIEANPARADHRDHAARGLPVAKHVQIAQHLRMVQSLDFRQAGNDAGRQHDLVIASARKAFRIGARPEAHLDARQLQLPAEIAQGFLKLLLARHLPGDVELAADLRCSLIKGNIVSASGRGHRAAQTGRPRAHHRDPLACGGGRDRQFRLVARQRVHEAGRDLAGEDVVEAGLVAGDAGVDLVSAVLAGLAHEEGIGQQRPGHRHHVAIAFGQQPLGHLRRVDAVGGDKRDRNLALKKLRHPGEGRTRHAGRDGGNACLVPADAGVDDGGARRLDCLAQAHHLFAR